MKTITKTALSNIKYNKSRSILTAIAITLTTCLLMALGTICYGMIQYQKSYIGKESGTYHAVFTKVTQDELTVLKQHIDVETVGTGDLFASIEKDKISAYLTNMDEAAGDMTSLQVTTGTMPQSSNDIIAQPQLFKVLGANPKVGEKVTVPFRVDGKGEIIEREFVICGLIQSSESSELTGKYAAMISEDFILEYMPPEDRTYSTLVRVKGEDSLNYDAIENRIKNVAKDIGISENRISLNKNYLIWITDPGTETITIGVSIGIIIIIFSILVIYSIFYVSIITKIQEFGKLQALGATKKQMKKLVLREGMILAGISIPIGEIIGYMVAYFGLRLVINLANKQKFDVPIFNIYIVFIVFLAVILTVYCSMRKPMRMASKISPVEAIRYQEVNTNKSIFRKGYEEVTLSRLTRANLLRNKKRTMITITTMGLSCVLFIVVANVLSSMNEKDLARRSIEKGDFKLVLDYSCNDKTYPENNLNQLQKDELLGSVILEEIKSIPGVKKLDTAEALMCQVDLSNGENCTSVGVISREDMAYIEEEYKRGNIDYDELIGNHGVIYMWDNWLEENGLAIGDKIPLLLYDGDEKKEIEVTLMGSTSSGGESFAIPEELIRNVIMNTDTTVAVYISAEKAKLSSVKQALTALADRSKYYKLTSLEDELNMAVLSMQMITLPIYGILLIIGIIGFMNLINTMITSIITRKRELGILQAIGLSDKQLIRMLQKEGMIFTVGTLSIALTVGNVLGYLTFLWAKKSSFMEVSAYHFPVIETVGLVLVVTIGQLLVTSVISRNIHKDSLVDRIRFEA